MFSNKSVFRESGVPSMLKETSSSLEERRLLYRNSILIWTTFCAFSRIFFWRRSNENSLFYKTLSKLFSKPKYPWKRIWKAKKIHFSRLWIRASRSAYFVRLCRVFKLICQIFFGKVRFPEKAIKKKNLIFFKKYFVENFVEIFLWRNFRQIFFITPVSIIWAVIFLRF